MERTGACWGGRDEPEPEPMTDLEVSPLYGEPLPPDLEPYITCKLDYPPSNNHRYLLHLPFREAQKLRGSRTMLVAPFWG